MRGYLSIEEISQIDKIIGQRLTSAVIYKFIYSGGLEVISFLKLSFNEKNSLIIGTGSIAEDIKLFTEEETIQEVTTFLKQGEVKLKEEDLIENTWKQFADSEILSYDLMDKKGYCYNSIILTLKDGKIEVEAGGDELLLFPFYNVK